MRYLMYVGRLGNSPDQPEEWSRRQRDGRGGVDDGCKLLPDAGSQLGVEERERDERVGEFWEQPRAARQRVPHDGVT